MNAFVRMQRGAPLQTESPPARSPGLLQCSCACGSAAGVAAEWEASHRDRLTGQHSTAPAAELAAGDGLPASVRAALRSPGQPLDAATRAFMEPRFGHDFSRVRVHADAQAAESARAVNAHAYTVGHDIVFSAGRHQPATPAGRQLLAHELAHVVQQRSMGAAPGNAPHLEAEAQRAAAAVVAAAGTRPVLSAAGPALLKSDGETERAPVEPVEPTEAQRGVIEDARRAAAIRTQIALMRVRGIVPPGPSGRYDPGEAMRRRARLLARRMFQWDDPNMDQIEEVISDMVSRLTNPRVMVAGANDHECGMRAAYVRGLRPPIVLCPTFFSDTPEQQIRTMIHEAAHLARIGNAGLGESYCVIFDCQTSCGGFDAADSWAHFIHCLSEQAPDQPTAIQGRPGGGGAP